MKPLVVIPARMSASRLPGKPLADIHGEPLIVHVWRRALAAGVGPVLVAAGEPEIVEAIEKAGGRALLTRADHPSGSDRVWEAVENADPHGHHDVIVNLQGDLPMLEPSAVVRVLEPLAEPAVDIATIAIEILDESERDTLARQVSELTLERSQQFRVPITWMAGQTLLGILLLVAFAINEQLPWPREPRRNIYAVLAIVVSASLMINSSIR